MTGLWITAGLVVAACICVPIAFTLIDRHQESAWRHEAGQAAPERGRHRAPKAATIPRAPTEHAPPWEGEHVIEPAAITSGPPPAGPDPWSLDPERVTPGPVTAEEARSLLGPEPEALAYWIAAGTYSEDGQVRTVRVELLPPVEALLGHASTGDAVAAMSAGWHSVESLFNGHHARRVRELTDGAS